VNTLAETENSNAKEENNYKCVFFYYILNSSKYNINNAIEKIKSMSDNGNKYYSFLLTWIDKSDLNKNILKFGTTKAKINIKYNIDFDKIACMIAQDFPALELSGKAVVFEDKISKIYYSYSDSDKVFIDNNNSENTELMDTVNEFKYNFYGSKLDNNAEYFTTKVSVTAGIKKNERIKALKNNDDIIIERDADSAYDQYSIIIKNSKNEILGYLQNSISKCMSTLLDNEIITLTNGRVLKAFPARDEFAQTERPKLEIIFNINFLRSEIKRLIIHKSTRKLNAIEYSDNVIKIKDTFDFSNNSDVISLEKLLDYDFEENGRVYNHIKILPFKYRKVQYNDDLSLSNNIYMIIGYILSIIDFNDYKENILPLSDSNVNEIYSLFSFTVEDFIKNIIAEAENSDFSNVIKTARIDENIKTILNVMRFLFSPKADFYEREIAAGFGALEKIAPDCISKHLENYNIDYTKDVLIQKVNFLHYGINEILKTDIKGFIFTKSKLNGIVALDCIDKGIISFSENDIICDKYSHHINNFRYDHNLILAHPSIAIAIERCRNEFINFVDFIEKNQDLIIDLSYINPSIHNYFNNQNVSALSLLRLFSTNEVSFNFREDVSNEQQYYTFSISEDMQNGIPNYKFFFAELLKEIILYNDKIINFNNIEFKTAGDTVDDKDASEAENESYQDDNANLEDTSNLSSEQKLIKLIKKTNVYHTKLDDFNAEMNNFEDGLNSIINKNRNSSNYMLNEERDILKNTVQFLNDVTKDIKDEFDIKIKDITENLNENHISNYMEAKVIIKDVSSNLNLYTSKLLRVMKILNNIDNSITDREYMEILIVNIINIGREIFNKISEEVYISLGTYGTKTFISKDITQAGTIKDNWDKEFESLPSTILKRELEERKEKERLIENERQNAQAKKEELEKELSKANAEFEQIKHKLFKGKERDKIQKKIKQLQKEIKELSNIE